jgi:hypothetical protein
MAVFQFIEGFYNPSRRHSAVGYRFSDRWSTAFGNGLSPRDYT